MRRFDPYPFHDDIGGPVVAGNVLVPGAVAAGLILVLALLIFIGSRGNMWTAG